MATNSVRPEYATFAALRLQIWLCLTGTLAATRQCMQRASPTLIGGGNVVQQDVTLTKCALSHDGAPSASEFLSSLVNYRLVGYLRHELSPDVDNKRAESCNR